MEIFALGLVGISLFYAGILLLASRFLPKIDDEERTRPRTFYQKFTKRFLNSSEEDRDVAA